MLLDSVPIGPRVPIFDLNIAPFDPTRVTHAQAKCSQTRFRFGIIFGNPKQYANAAHPLRLLCVQCERPCCDRTANKHDELAPTCTEQTSPRAYTVKAPHIASLTTKAFFRKCQIRFRLTESQPNELAPLHS